MNAGKINAMEVIKKLDGWYGPGQGFSVYTTIMPGILRDFNQMLQENPGQTVQEEYRLEDGKGSLFLSGRLLKNGEQEIEIRCQ